MKKYLFTGLIGAGTLMLVAAIFIGGWLFLDNVDFAPYSDTGTRSLFQEASRAEAMEQPIAYAGSEKCMTCHFPSSEEWLHSSHNTVACEDCHGPGNLHATEGAPMEVSTSSSLCLTCHARLDSRPEDFPQIPSDEHGRGNECTTCHNPMHPAIFGAPKMPDISGEMTDCVACHEPDKLITMPDNHAGRTADSCVECHEVKTASHIQEVQ